MASLETVGMILVVAMLITPGATGHLLTDRFATMLWFSVMVGVSSAVLGLWLSFVLDVASGGAIVLVATGLFLMALLISSKHGVIMRQWRRWRMISS
ncbi:metal ABC transporter permease [Vreelandella vilamensis]|uniref:metal ABC transporter permease n=1 Tax=Vreelandella vilamensis TaxID=531309 RepID=UPI00286D3800|nr:metal ABC transporter permease [Halomonas vilamensis]